MRTKFLSMVFMALNLASAYCEGIIQTSLVNEQEIPVEGIDIVEIFYPWEDIAVFRNSTPSLIIKEYMNRDDRDYYAKISNSGNKVLVRSGHRPLRLFNFYYARIEIYIPSSNTIDISIKTASGGIRAEDEYVCSAMTIESASGSLWINTITADRINLKTSSGGIYAEAINGNTRVKSHSGSIGLGNINGDVSIESFSGDVNCERTAGNAKVRARSGRIVVNSTEGDISVETSSGRADINMVTGNIRAKTSSGSIHCSVTEGAGNISLASSSGSVNLDLPQNYNFNFLSRTFSGNLSTPFSDRLFSPVSDRRSVQGTIGGDGSGNNPKNNVNITTNSGSITIKRTK
jgi:DUF4097 and DUF4098 domain-containing protein YvlB